MFYNTIMEPQSSIPNVYCQGLLSFMSQIKSIFPFLPMLQKYGFLSFSIKAGMVLAAHIPWYSSCI